MCRVCDLCAYYGEFPRDVFARCVRVNLDSTRGYDCHYYYFTITVSSVLGKDVF